MVRRVSSLALMLPPELAGGELHRQDLLARAHRFHLADDGSSRRGEFEGKESIAPAFDVMSGPRAVAAADDLIRRHQERHRS